MRTLGAYKTSTLRSTTRVSKTMSTLRSLKRNTCLSNYSTGVNRINRGLDDNGYLVSA